MSMILTYLAVTMCIHIIIHQFQNQLVKFNFKVHDIAATVLYLLTVLGVGITFKSNITCYCSSKVIYYR